MACGLARLFGVRIQQNFRLPYFSPNPSALWTRWHRTLAAWFRDYVYGPLSRRWPGPRGRALALLATMTLVGLWHGARWTFVLWGFLWGLALISHRALRRPLANLVEGRPGASRWLTVGGVLLTFHLWLLLGSLFVAPRVDLALAMGWRLLTGFDASASAVRDGITVLYYSAPLLVLEAVQLARGRLDVVGALPAPLRLAVYVGLATLLVVMGAETDQEFFYFAF
jgi:D-alanyl-lipoteichoic acid acyltransferase DltB (MBOAT superfamily)